MNCVVNIFVSHSYHGTVSAWTILVRAIVELVTNERYYSDKYSQFIGPVDVAIRAVCKNHTFSELYEIDALCNLLKCNIRSVLPNIDIREEMAIFNSVITPMPSIIANFTITILWSHACNEIQARIDNNSNWSPNHFVPLMLPFDQNEIRPNDQSNLALVVSYIMSMYMYAKQCLILFRLLKRELLRTMLLFKYEFLNFNYLLADVYEMKSTSWIILLNRSYLL